jgi:cytochrome c oxidase subunit I
VLVATLAMEALDRTAQTSFFVPGAGGSNFLYENLFWVFGHPEVYILALPGFAIVLEILPVFARKPLWGYRLAVAGLMGVTLLSWMVWQHHLFVSGINGDLRPFYMLSTELISIPTGFTFICGMMTLWRGHIRYTVPMLFCLAWFFNFLVGGLSGVFLSDVPSDVTTHGSFFSMAHFHYTIMGGLIFTFFAALYYWVPKMTGLQLDERLGKIHFWLTMIGFHGTFLVQHWLGTKGMPRRYADYLPGDGFTFLNTFSTIGSFILGLSTLPFIYNVWKSYKVGRVVNVDDPWGHGNSLEWATSSPPPRHNFLEIPRIRSERPAFEAHYPHLVERLHAEAHAGKRHEPYASELVGGTGERQGPNDPDPL